MPQVPVVHGDTRPSAWMCIKLYTLFSPQSRSCVHGEVREIQSIAVSARLLGGW